MSETADVDVVVVAEVLKPEDRAVLAGSDARARPVLVALNKADLTGFGAGGPMALAHRHAAHYRALTGVPTVPTVGLLATAVLDDELVCALRTLATEPADLTSTDAFLQAAHRLSRDVRARLLDTLDRFGIAHAVLALSRGVDAASLPALLRRLSQIDRVVAQLTATGAAVRYRRVRSALAELQALAVQSGDERLTEFLSADDTVVAVMAAAVEVIEASGVDVDPVTTRPHICAARCTGGATRAHPSTRCTAAAPPISPGVRCVFSRGRSGPPVTRDDPRPGCGGGRSGRGDRSGPELAGTWRAATSCWSPGRGWPEPPA